MTSPGSSSNKQDQVLNDLASFYMSSTDFDFTPPPSPTKDKVEKVDTPPTSDSEPSDPVHVQRNEFISSIQDVTSRRRKPSSKKRPTSSSALAAIMMAPVAEEANRRRVATAATTSTTTTSTTNSSRRAPKSSPNNHHSSGNKSSSATATVAATAAAAATEKSSTDDTFGPSSSTHRRVPPGRNKSVGDSSTKERSTHHRRGRSIPAMGNNNNNNNNSSHGSQHQRSVHAEKPQRSFSGGGGGSHHRRTTVPTPAKEGPLKGSSHGRSALDRIKSRSVSKGSRRLPARSHSDDLTEMNRSRRQQSQSRDTGRRRKRRSSEDSLALSNHAAQAKSELEEEDNLQRSMEDAIKSLKDQEKDGLADGQVDGIISMDALEKARDLKKVSSAQREAISTNQPVVLGRSGSEEGLSEIDRSRSNGGRRRRRPGAPSTSSTTKPSSSTSSNQGTSTTTKPLSSTGSNHGTSTTTKPSSSTSSHQGQHRGERRLRSSGRGKSPRSPNKQQQLVESSSSSKRAPRSPRKNQEPSSSGGSNGRRSPRSPRRNQEPSSSGGSSGRRSPRSNQEPSNTGGSSGRRSPHYNQEPSNSGGSSGRRSARGRGNSTKRSAIQDPTVVVEDDTADDDLSLTSPLKSSSRPSSNPSPLASKLEKVGHASQDEMSIQPADLGIPPPENTTDVAATGKNTAPSALKPTQHDDLIAQAASRQEVLSEIVENKQPKKHTSKLFKKLLSKGMKSKKKEPAVASTESTTVDDTTKSMESTHGTDSSDREDNAPVIPAATVTAVPRPEDTNRKSMLGKLLSKSSSSTGAQKDAAGEGEAGAKKKGSKWGGLKGGMDFPRQMIKIKKTKDNSKEATTQEPSSGGSSGALMEKTNVPEEPATTKKKGGLWKLAKEGAGSGNSALAKEEEAKGEESTKYGGRGGSQDLDYRLMMSLGSFSEDAIGGLADYLPKGTFPQGEGDDEDASDTKIDPADDDNAKPSSHSLRSSSKSLQSTKSQEEKSTGDQEATNQSNAFAMLGKEAESDQPNAFSMLNIAPVRAPSITSTATTATTTATTAVNPTDRRGMITGLAAPNMHFDLDKQTDEVASRSEPAIIEECEEEDSEKDQEEIEDEDEAMSEYGTVKKDEDKDIMTDYSRGRTQEDEIEDELQSFLAPMNFMQLKIDPSTTNVVDLNVAMHALSEECKSISTEGENTMNVQHMNEAGIDFEESSDSDSEVDKGASLMSCPSVVNNQTKLSPTYDVQTEYTQLLQELDASTTRTKRSREEVKSLQQEIQKQRRHYGEAERQHQMSLKALDRHKIVLKR